MGRIWGWLVAAVVLAAGQPAAADKAFRLRVAPELIESGFVKFVVPRFSLKTGIRIATEPLDLPVDTLEDADFFLLQSALLPAMPETAMRRDVFTEIGGRRFTAVILQGVAKDHAARFLDWLTSKVGEATLAAFKVDGEAVYEVVEPEVIEEVAAVPTGDAALGEKIAVRRCGRCHVVSDSNRFAGIGSTPSFGALKTLPRWQQRFEAFWTLNPHPSFTQIEGVTEPFDPERPPHVAPLVMTLKEVEALLAFVHAIKPKDLGAPLLVK